MKPKRPPRCAWCGLSTPLGNVHLGCRPMLDVRATIAASLLDEHLKKAKTWDLTYEELFSITPKRGYA